MNYGTIIFSYILKIKVSIAILLIISCTGLLSCTETPLDSDDENQQGSNSQLVLSAHSHDFGSVPIGDSLEWSLRIVNIGKTSTIINRIFANKSAFSLLHSDLPYDLESSDSIICTIIFSPSYDTIYNDTLIVETSDKPKSKILIPLQGVGVANAFKLPIPYYNQGNTSWCVPASMAMILKYFGKNIHQWDIAQSWDFDRNSNQWSFIDQKRNVIEYFSNNGLLVNEIQKIPITIKNQIQNGRPVFLSISGISLPFFDKTGHTIVIVGYENYGDGYKFYINDPGMVFTNNSMEIPSLVDWEDINGDWYTKEYLIALSGNSLAPPKGTFDIGNTDGPNWNGGLYFKIENGLPEIYSWMYGGEVGLGWKSNSGDPVILGSHYFQFGGAITNHTEEDQTYKVKLNFSGGDYNPPPKTFNATVGANSYTGNPNNPIMTEPVLLSDYLNNKIDHYYITLSLFDQTGHTLYDSFQFPAILYDGINEFMPIWSYTFGGTGDDGVNALQRASDGGYVMAGITLSYGLGDGDVWFIKTNEQGEEEWEQTFGSIERDIARDIELVSDGGYIITGTTWAGLRSDILLIKTDEQGNEEWSRTFGSSDRDYSAESVKETLDGGYILVGKSRDHDWLYGNHSDIKLIKVNSQGYEEWTKTFDNPGSDGANSVQLTSSGGFIIAGYTNNNDKSALLIKTDNDGETIWSQRFSGQGGAAKFHKVLPLNDGGFILVGETSYSGYSDGWVVKTNNTGDKVWSNTFDGGSSGHDSFTDIKLIPDGGYIITGGTYSPNSVVSDAWVLRVDTNGDTLHTYKIGGDNSDTGVEILFIQSGEYVVVGNTESYGSGRSDAWIFKIEEDNYIIE